MNNDLFAIAVLAQRRARIEVKAELKSRGICLSYVFAPELKALANDYLRAHRNDVLAHAQAEWKAISRSKRY
jgi:hypothetical protein